MLLFIDDIRNPNTVFSISYRDKMGLRPFTDEERNVIIESRKSKTIDIARSYEEAIQLLSKKKYDMIMFDHDLGENEQTGESLKSGKDVANWISRNLNYKFLFYVHSANPIGRENIRSYLSQWMDSLV